MTICGRSRTDWIGTVECGQRADHNESGSDHIARINWQGEEVDVTWSDRFPNAVDIRFPAEREDRP